MEDARLTLMVGHYNETFKMLKQDAARRDRLFLYILLLLVGVLFHMLAPDVVTGLLGRLVQAQTGLDDAAGVTDVLDVTFIGVMLWFGLLSLAHTYYQTVLHVERQYDYLYQLETRLSDYFEGQAFTREGAHYRAHRYLFSSWTKMIFWVLFPLFLLLVVSYRLRTLIASPGSPMYFWVMILITTALLVSTGLYLLALYRQR